MDTAQWQQEIVVKPIEEIVVTNTCPKPASASSIDTRKPRPLKEQALNCPRCHSTNTKFCYYNNYSLTQPRYFCKTCRRYWTEGGSLRNIPVGGGSRKNKRSSASCNASIPSPKSIKLHHHDLVFTPQQSLSQNCTQSNNNNTKIQEGQDLNLAFPASTTTTRDYRNNISELVQQNNNNNVSASASSSSTTTSTTTASTSHQFSALELLTGITTASSSRGLNSFMPVPSSHDPHTVYNFPLIQDFKPSSLNFSLDGIGSGFGSLHGVQETSGGGGGRLLFPFEDLKQVSITATTTTTTTTMDQNNNNKEQLQGDSTGYWTGMLGGGSW